MASSTNPQLLHAIIVPLMSQSHLIPMIGLAKLLAKRGIVVTIIVTPPNALKYNPIINQATAKSDLKINLISLPLPCKEAGLPEGCESIDNLPSPHFLKQFFLATGLLQQPLETFLRTVDPRPSCIISGLPWTCSIAHKFNIPRYAFQGVSCFTLACSHHMEAGNHSNDHHQRHIESEHEPFLVPNVPDRIEFTYAQLPQTIRVGDLDQDFKGMQNRIREAEETADGLLLNTFEELEPEYVKLYQRVRRNVLCIGPLSSFDREGGCGHKSSMNEHFCAKWLDSMKPKSVIYACFGSLSRLSSKQLIELGSGLEQSNRPFIWIVREDVEDGNNYVDQKFTAWMSNYEERVKGRGLVVKGWAPQVKILSHCAIGGFLTHCGWNSTVEGVCAGVPMITWPMFAEQFYNEKLIVQVLKIGVRIGVRQQVVATRCGEEQDEDHHQDGAFVSREHVTGAINKLFDDDGEEGKERRRRSQQFGDAARVATEEGGSSFMNVTFFIRHMVQQLSLKKRSSLRS